VMLGNYNATDEDYLPLINAATSLVSRSQNVSSVNDLADLVFIVLPGGTRGEWISFSTLSGRLSVFNNQWAAKASTLAHGFGHNFGLDHARRTGGAARVEETGFMGLADDSPEVSDKCFNAANYWDLGWVSERAMTLNVSEKSTSIVPLTSIVQVDPDAQDEVVVLKVEDLYILYNQAKRFNSDTGDLRNNVVIVRPVTWGTQLVAGLDVVQPLFTRTCSNGSTLMIELCRATAKEGDVQGATRAGNVTARPGQVLLSVGYNKSLCPLPIPTPTGPQTNASQVPPLLPGSPTVTSDDSTSESGAQSRASPRSIRIWISVLVACLGILAILAWVVYRRRRRRSHARCELSRPRSSYRKMDSTTFRSAGDNDDDDMSSCGDGLGSVGGVSFASESTRVLSNVTGTAAMTACTSTTVAPPNAAAAASSHQEPAPTTVRRSYYYSGGPNSRLPVSVHVPVVAVRPDSSSARYLNRDMTRSPVHPAAGAEGPRDAQSCARADWLFEEGLWGASEI
jgi:Gametolysin peptidase M11